MFEQQKNPEGIRELLHESALASVGIRRFTADELNHAVVALQEMVTTRLQDADTLVTDGHADHIVPITVDAVLAVPSNSRVLVSRWGGTQQQSLLLEKIDESTLEQTIINPLPVPKDSRTMPQHGLAEAIGDHLLHGMNHHGAEAVTSVAVSLGTPQRNRRVSYGVEAYLSDTAPSNWNITDFSTNYDEQVPLGKHLLDYLKHKGVQKNGEAKITEVYFQPDTNAVGHDVIPTNNGTNAYLPMGVVAGTGTNIALEGVNLEISTSLAFPKDPTFDAMITYGYIPQGTKPYTKFLTGGDRIPNRVAAGIRLIADDFPAFCRSTSAEQIATLLRQEKGGLVSQLAANNLSLAAFRTNFEIDITQEEFILLKTACKRALEQAGQVMATMITASVKTRGYEHTKAYIPLEGSVIHTGFGVKDMMMKELDILLPDNKLRFNASEASGVSGVAKMALVFSAEKLKNEKTV